MKKIKLPEPTLFLSVFLMLAFGICTTCASAQNANSTDSMPVPELFEPNVISTSLDELNACFSPDGKTLFYSLNAIGDKFGVIVMSELKNGKWSTPVKAPFSTGLYTDYDPFITRDGNKLFFISDRPVPERNDKRKNFDIYVVEKENGKWSSKAKNLGPIINNDRSQFYPSIAANGNLYFSTALDSSFDICYSKLVNGQYTTPVKLNGKINTNRGEFDNCISPNEDFIVFSSTGRRNSKGSSDLYISFNVNGEWTEGLNLGSTINSPAFDYCPILSPDGQYLYFTSMRGMFDAPLTKPLGSYEEVKAAYTGMLNGSGNIYRIKLTRELLDRWKQKVLSGADSL